MDQQKKSADYSWFCFPTAPTQGLTVRQKKNNNNKKNTTPTKNDLFDVEKKMKNEKQEKKERRCKIKTRLTRYL